MDSTTKSSHILGVIPARGGSRGIPLKNIRPLLGKPLILYTIEAAKKAKGMDACLVSTDSQEIARISQEAGAWVPFLRPAELATDESPTWCTLMHAILYYEQISGCMVDSVVTLQPTTPLRLPEDIEGAIRTFKEAQPQADSLISACEADHMHPLTLYRRDGPWLRPFLPGENHTRRRQEWEKIYWRNGAVYISKRDLVMEGHRVVGDQPLLYEMPSIRSVSIDTEEDLELAELRLRYSAPDPVRGNRNE
ncbi:MAG: acylneuraminate cytidylyltransferase family protein [bacterium]